MILLVRSWPAPDELRKFATMPPHVWDTIPKIYCTGNDYRPVRDRLLESNQAGVLHFDWDLAIAKEDLKILRDRARAEPEQGFVIPFRLYPAHIWSSGRAVRRGAAFDPSTGWEPLTGGETECDLPCFGAIYLPRAIAEKWEPAPHDPRMTDTNFAFWSLRQGLSWPVCWDVKPIHCHW